MIVFTSCVKRMTATKDRTVIARHDMIRNIHVGRGGWNDFRQSGEVFCMRQVL